jgi:hypothetical protein
VRASRGRAVRVVQPLQVTTVQLRSQRVSEATRSFRKRRRGVHNDRARRPPHMPSVVRPSRAFFRLIQDRASGKSCRSRDVR